jgi:hypothetical protein
MLALTSSGELNLSSTHFLASGKLTGIGNAAPGIAGPLFTTMPFNERQLPQLHLAFDCVKAKWRSFSFLYDGR